MPQATSNIAAPVVQYWYSQTCADGMNKLDVEKRAKLIHLMCSGMPLRRIADVEKVSLATVMRLLRLAGATCHLYHFDNVRDIPGRRNIQCDELWSFVYAKEKRVPYVKPLDAAGTAWTWTALDADSKLLVSYLISKKRNTRAAIKLFSDVRSRLLERPRITADQLSAYRKASKEVFGKKGRKTLSQTRKGVDTGHSTAHVERHNLTIRRENSRYARKTNAFSKKLSRHIRMMDLWAVHYNFCRIHGTLRVTPAMEAGLTTELHDCEWIVGLIDLMTMPPKKPGPKVGTKYGPRKKS